MFKVPEKWRVTVGSLWTCTDDGNNGYFRIPEKGSQKVFCVIASDGLGWEHVSVHVEMINHPKRTYTPTWEDMCKVKAMFWDGEDVVIQFHPRESEYVNNHPNTLHLWRPVGAEIPIPPSILVGIKGFEVKL